MDIAMVFDGLAVGGIERVGADYARLLRELGHTVTVINLRPQQTEFEAQFDGPVEHVRFPRAFAPDSRATLARGPLGQKLRFSPVYAALSAANAAYRPVCRAGCPALRRTYDLAIAFSGHFNDLTFVASGFVRAERTLCWLHGALYQYILLSGGFLPLYHRIKNLVVLTEDAQEEVLRYIPSAGLHIRKLYNPILMDPAAADAGLAARLREEYGRFLLMVDRFNYPYKDHYTVVDALRALRERYGDEPHLVFVGSGADEPRVRDYVASLGEPVASHVHFMGSRMDTQSFYRAAYVSVHACAAGEGLPTVMLEALAFGLPIVATDSRVGPREILGDNEYGLLCRVKDPEDMAEKLHRLLHDQALYDTYRDRSAERLRAFSPETVKGRLAALLAELTDGEARA